MRGVRRHTRAGGSFVEHHDMQPYEYSVSLRVFHPSAEPSEITRELGMEPRRTWKVGDPRATPTGTPLPGTYAESYWYTKLCSLVASSAESLESALLRLVGGLRNHEQFFLRVRRDGGRAEFYVGVNGPRSYGFEFDPVLMTELASIGLTLSLEVYAVPQNS